MSYRPSAWHTDISGRHGFLSTALVTVAGSNLLQLPTRCPLGFEAPAGCNNDGLISFSYSAKRTSDLCSHRLPSVTMDDLKSLVARTLVASLPCWTVGAAMMLKATPGGSPPREYSPGSKQELVAQAGNATLPGQLDAVSATCVS